MYEVKARFSEILRMVREGQTITVTYHGKPVAEIKPLQENPTLEEHLNRLEERGVLHRTPGRPKLTPVAKRPGALKRFLADRSRF